MIDVNEKKNKIISFLETSGPSLPVRIAKAIQMDPVFASAILSELLGSKQIKLSHMKIGSSPLYLLPGQEQKLEDQTDNLKSVEKEAYLKLKEIKLITDETETPATRVALRNIKDFATPFKFKEKIMWKYTFTPDEEINKLLSPPEKTPEPEEEPEVKEPKEEIKEEKQEPIKPEPKEPKPEKEPENVPKAWEVKKEEIKHIKEESKKVEPIFDKPQATKSTSDEAISAPLKKSFLEQVEEFLENKDTSIISIEEVDKKKVIAKTQNNEEKALLFAFNKQRVNETEIMTCYKEAKKQNLPYHIIILGNLTKKMNDTIDAYKKLLKIERLTP